jgi:hypothetical protein
VGVGLLEANDGKATRELFHELCAHAALHFARLDGVDFAE